MADSKKRSSCWIVLVVSLPNHLTLTVDLISRWPNLEIKPSDQGKPLARVTFFSVTLSSKCPGHLTPGLALARRVLNECYRIQSSPFCKTTPGEAEVDQPAQGPKAGRCGTGVGIPSTAFFFTDPCCLPLCPWPYTLTPSEMNLGLLRHLPAWGLSLSFPPHPAFPGAMLVTHGSAHCLEVFGHVFLATCMMKSRK